MYLSWNNKYWNCLKQTVVKIGEENLNMCNTFIIFQGHGWSRRFHLLQEVDQSTRPDLVQAEPIAPIPTEEQPDLQAGKHCRFILPSNGRDTWGNYLIYSLAFTQIPYLNIIPFSNQKYKFKVSCAGFRRSARSLLRWFV